MSRFVLVVVLAGCGQSFPLNGDFAEWANGSPAHWVQEPGAALSQGMGPRGETFLRFPAGEPSGTMPLRSEPFEVEPGVSYLLSWVVRAEGPSSGGQVGVAIVWLTSPRLELGVVGLDVGDSAAAGELGGAWVERGTAATAPDDARFAAVLLEGTVSGDLVLDVASVAVERHRMQP
jgi:hypothetical protein